ncbi:hypothetical protein [Allorhizobium borbori]|uniref:Uncharacterized protein n=1 Tax=Allorhizobium borbori TaxID=485907 RepID=A0A7W6K1X0_9HYPH|nr:hypothetical protein [Allorhizobium borbori]MBB4103680.1 hypothetical protein [Allorhizobium borbori]
MSSDIYPSSLSRNLVRAGAYGYRENAVLGLFLTEVEGAGEEAGLGFASATTFVTYPDFGTMPTVRPTAVNFGRNHLSMQAVSLGQRTAVGPHPL